MIKNIILSGGAFRCCSHIGVIQYLEEHKAMQHVTTFIGTSAGSLICFMLCLGFTSAEMKRAIKDFLATQEECPPDLDNIINLYYTMGMSDGEMIPKYIEKVLREKKFASPSSTTFIEFAKVTGKNLVVSASKLPTLDNFYFSVETTPNVPIATAIRASCSLPLIFTPITIDDATYIDSGLVNNFPHDYVKNNMLKDSLGVHIKGCPLEMPKNMDLLQMFKIIFDALMRKANKSNGTSNSSIGVIEISQDGCDGMDVNFDMSTCSFTMPDDKIQSFIDFGYEKAKEFFTTGCTPQDATQSHN